MKCLRIFTCRGTPANLQLVFGVELWDVGPGKAELVAFGPGPLCLRLEATGLGVELRAKGSGWRMREFRGEGSRGLVFIYQLRDDTPVLGFVSGMICC